MRTSEEMIKIIEKLSKIREKSKKEYLDFAYKQTDITLWSDGYKYNQMLKNLVEVEEENNLNLINFEDFFSENSGFTDNQRYELLYDMISLNNDVLDTFLIKEAAKIKNSDSDELITTKKMTIRNILTAPTQRIIDSVLNSGSPEIIKELLSLKEYEHIRPLVMERFMFVNFSSDSDALRQYNNMKVITDDFHIGRNDLFIDILKKLQASGNYIELKSEVLSYSLQAVMNEKLGNPNISVDERNFIELGEHSDKLERYSDEVNKKMDELMGKYNLSKPVQENSKIDETVDISSLKN